MSKLKEDFLSVDPDIPGQNFVCMSFIEPTNKDLLADKESYICSHFIKNFIDEYNTAKQYIDENKVEEEKLSDEVKNKIDLSYENINNMYYNFRKTNFGTLHNEFINQDNKNREITVRGLKIRGIYNTYEEASRRAAFIRDNFDEIHNVFVGQVGYWIPFNPVNMDEIKAQYAEDQLNELVKEKTILDEKDKKMFEERKQKMIENVFEKNDVNVSRAIEHSSSSQGEEKFEIIPETDEIKEEMKDEEKTEEKKKKGRISRKIANKRKINKKK